MADAGRPRGRSGCPSPRSASTCGRARAHLPVARWWTPEEFDRLGRGRPGAGSGPRGGLAAHPVELPRQARRPAAAGAVPGRPSPLRPRPRRRRTATGLRSAGRRAGSRRCRPSSAACWARRSARGASRPGCPGAGCRRRAARRVAGGRRRRRWRAPAARCAAARPAPRAAGRRRGRRRRRRRGRARSGAGGRRGAAEAGERVGGWPRALGLRGTGACSCEVRVVASAARRLAGTLAAGQATPRTRTDDQQDHDAADDHGLDGDRWRADAPRPGAEADGREPCRVASTVPGPPHGQRRRARPGRGSGDEVLGLGVVADDGVGGLLGVELEPLAHRRPRSGRPRAARRPWRCPRGRGTPGSPSCSGRPGTAGGTGRSASARPRRRSPAPRGCGGASTRPAPRPSRRRGRGGTGSRWYSLPANSSRPPPRRPACPW